MVVVCWAVLAASIVEPSGGTTGTLTGDVVSGIFGIVLSLVFLGVIYIRGVLASLGIVLGALAIGFAVFVVTGGAVAVGFAVAVVGFAVAGAVAGAVAFAVAVGFAVAGAVVVAFAFAVVVGFAVAGAGAVDVAGAVADNRVIVIAITVIGILGNTVIDFFDSETRIVRRF